ncbi:MAG: phosphatase PAP2 family protein [Parachlamydiaceae bacterium]|nr:phosphatase PAP2 family protein [Parachlamydiaceae bacterium]
MGVTFLFAMDLILFKKGVQPLITTAQKIVLVISAVIVAMSRYLCKKHWSTDILGGAMLGIASGYLTSKMVAIYQF